MRIVRFGVLLVAAICLLGFQVDGQATSGADKFDGPAELPRIYVRSAMADTPAPGKTIPVKQEDNLQNAIKDASCGDTIQLEAGGHWVGDFKFPAKKCDDAHWIIIRTGASDQELPPEGTRLTPCFAGIASLPGRPQYPCPSPKNVTARIVLPGGGKGPITLEDGANHYRFVGLEITREAPGKPVYNLVSHEGEGAFDHIIFDRVWLHGTPQDETTRGLMLTASSHVAVIDSYFSDFHCVAATGACIDSQAVGGGVGDKPMGPYKIVNNFMEASGQSILLGGGPATLTPADIEIRHNHFFKPLTWKPGNSAFVGGASGKPFIIKNLFELKNAERVLLEGNIMENTWGGFSQAGFAILLTPKNQGNRCAICKVADVVIRNNRISHMASGMTIGTGLSDAGGAASGGTRYSIHDNIFEDIDGQAYGGTGAFLQITSTVPALRDVSISHNTAFPSRALFIIGVDLNREKIVNFTFTDNLVGAAEDILSTGGGPRNCSFQPQAQGPSGILKNCFAGYKVVNNAFVGSGGGWPKGNMSLRDLGAAGVTDAQNKGKGTYRLCAAKGEPHPNCKKESPLLHAATEGRVIGADYDSVTSATAGVE